jgi:hypothetical protein
MPRWTGRVAVLSCKYIIEKFLKKEKRKGGNAYWMDPDECSVNIK